jgi:ATP diphosphatase
VRNWQLLKDAEHAADLDDPDTLVPRALPALPRAQKLAGKLARRGFDWPDAAAVLEKLEEEVRELRAAVEAGRADEMAHELGDVLLAAACLARHLDVPAEIALHDASARLLERVRHVEAEAARLGRPTTALSPAELDRLWQNAKRGG